MKKRKLGRTDLMVSEIGFGALEIGRAWGLPIEGDFAVPPEREVEALLDRVLALGINLIDTAPAYMLSEERIGKMLKARRKEFYLASKCGEEFSGYDSQYDFSTAATVRSIDNSLRRLQTDCIDLIQIHCGPDEIGTIRRGETLDGMMRAKKAGKVRWVGVSCNADGARAALETGGYDVFQLPYSMTNRAIEGDILQGAAEQGIGVMIRESLERGKLTDKVRKPEAGNDPTSARLREMLRGWEARGLRTPISSVAIQFVLRRPQVSTVLIGTRNARHVEGAIEAAGAPLDASLLKEIDALTA
jgi:aryl-alcohol dehydrogenase-like predicted oxidoreductase